MNELVIFKKLIEDLINSAESVKRSSPWKEYKKKLIFGNTTFEIEGKVNTGKYEFYDNNIVSEEQKKNLETAINNSFEEIREGKCFSLYKYLFSKHLRFARLLRTRNKNPNDRCRFSSDSLEDDINSTGSSIVIISEKEENQKMDNDQQASLKTIIDEYDSYYNVVYGNEDKELYFYLVRPSIDNDKLNGMLYFSSSCEISSQALKELATLLASRLVDVVCDKLKKESIKSAKASIMSRNLSHNLGSHVMSYLKQSLKSVADMEKSGVLVEVSPKGEELPCLKSKTKDTNGEQVEEESKQGIKDTNGEQVEEESKQGIKPELPYLVGTGRFISYLQERQDYIATISTDYIPYPSIVNFKDCIYDELNPDYRFQRHPEWKGHKPANILLENIARSEGLSRLPKEEQRGSNIVMKYRDFDGLNTDNAKDDYDSLRKWNFSLPGGIMGRQAVFSIVENVIRNAAKHGKRDADQDLIVTFDIIDPIESDSLSGFEDVFKKRYSKIKNEDGYSKDIDELYLVTITTNTEANNDIINKIKKAIYEDLTDASLNKSNKGIKEMKISAAWLRGLKMEELDERERGEIAPVLWAREEKGNLQYVFCVPKVKEVALIVSEGNALLEKNNDSSWKYNGWYVFSMEEYRNLQSKNFNFVILDKNLSNNKEELRKCSTNRFFIEADNTDLQEQKIQFDFNQCIDFKENEDFSNAESDLYRQLVGDDLSEIKIAISDKNFDSKSDYVVNVQGLNCGEDCLGDYQYIYRKHNDTKTEFDKFGSLYVKRGNWSKLEFVEGITGGNSTDRLIRHEVIDNVWAYKHLHAMKTKVAIFDERLFTTIIGVESSALQSAFIDWNELLKEKTDDEAKDFVGNFDDTHDMKLTQSEELMVTFNGFTKKEVLEFAMKNYKSGGKFPVIGSLSNVCHKKKIDLFTLTQTNCGVKIWGVCFDNTYDGQVELVGSINLEKNGENKIVPKVIRYSSGDNDTETYDYLSIHQGLLDKVYEAFPGFSNSAENRMALSSAIYRSFVNPKAKENDYLQGMVIHSGRSKPNSDDMPQHQPFLQYSAIENALFDCKFTLVEVLDYACFEVK